jgi:hypothetical protein
MAVLGVALRSVEYSDLIRLTPPVEYECSTNDLLVRLSAGLGLLR